MKYIIPFYAIFFLTSLLMPLAIRSAACMGILDCPNARKIHTRPIPRTGGIVIAFSVLILYLCITDLSPFTLGYASGGCIIFFSGIVDDCKTLNYKWKLLLQVLATLVFIGISGDSIDFFGKIFPTISFSSNFFRIFVSVVFVVASINIINLSDGLDALAAGLSIIVFICLSFLAYTSGNMPIVFLSILMMGAILGFLRFNIFPASVFMGDTGSQFIGFTIGTALISITQDGSIYSPLLSLFILGVPVVDTFYVIYFRSINGRNPFLPDKNHVHHKLIQMGFSQDKSVAIIYTMHFLLIICGWSLRFYPDIVLLGIYCIVFVLLFAIRKFVITGGSRSGRFVSKANELWQSTMAHPSFFSRIFVSKIIWKLFFICLGGYYLFAPLLAEKVDHSILLVFLCLFFIFFLFYLSKGYVEDWHIKSLFYVVSLLTVIYFKDTIPLYINNSVYNVYIHDIFIFLLSILYFLCIVFSPEKAPLNSIDYILMCFIIFIFFLPDSISFVDRYKSIVIKIILLGFFINLVFSRIERNKKFIFYICIYLFFSIFLKISFDRFLI